MPASLLLGIAFAKSRAVPSNLPFKAWRKRFQLSGIRRPLITGLTVNVGGMF